jgi:hypothetical protein
MAKYIIVECDLFTVMVLTYDVESQHQLLFNKKGIFKEFCKQKNVTS